MPSHIELDAKRAREIIKGRVRKDLKELINHGEMIGRQGRKMVTIPVPGINEPRFVHGLNKGSGGVAQGEGEVGQPIGTGGNQGDGEGQAGSEPGSGHTRDVEVSIEELARMLGEELELPLLPKNSQRLVTLHHHYKALRKHGIKSLLSFDTSYLNAVLRTLSDLDPEMVLVPGFDMSDYIYLDKPDMRFRTVTIEEERNSSAAVIFMMDVSGSMTNEQKELVRTMAFWIETWLAGSYPDVAIRYIIHDAVAKEVGEDAFYHTHESGGTRISSGYEIVRAMISPESGYFSEFGGTYDMNDWNIFMFQFSDGDNWGEDNATCLELLSREILPKLNIYGYSQVKSPYGSGDYIREVKRLEGKFSNVRLATVNQKEEIYLALKSLLGKGVNHV